MDTDQIPTAIAVEQDIPAYDARRLTLDGGQARIVLDGQVYSLRITRANKLILTK
ncbi:hemin uptake protein HemP [Falsihalocynthiibacter sp. SS001]|uniref:hemin uptake protein HemP n=1 Tax=Falsihalocynthiibacter sp. SS001 TaxID=3349698 RepID=UPI0036D28C24